MAFTKTSAAIFTVQTPLSFTGTSAQSSAVNAQTRLVRLHPTEDCHIAISASPTATTSDFFLPADQTEYLQIEPGMKIACIRTTTSGTLHIAEMCV